MEAPRNITRKRSRESGAERRSKDRERKRRKRAAPATAPVVDNSSSSDEGNLQETTGDVHAEAHLFETDAGAAAWFRSRQAEGGRQGNRAENMSGTSTATTESMESDTPAQGGTSGTEGRTERGDAAALGDNGLHNFSVDFPQQDNEEEHDSADGVSPERAETAKGTRQEEEGNENPQGFPENSAQHQEAATAQRGEEGNDFAGQRQGDPGEPPGNPGGNQADQYSAYERLAMALAGVRGSSHISDEAINKMLHVALHHREALQTLADGRKTRKLYTKRLRPKAVKRIPQVFCAILLEEKVQGGLNYRRLSDLTGIPKEYQNLPNRGSIKVIREESYVRLADIKKHHARIHRAKGATEEDLRNHYGNAQLSVDGVEEAHKCKKTFHVVTLRLGSCIYLYKIFNPLVGHRVASPSVQEVLG